FAFTFLNASTTACFGIANGLSVDPGWFTRLLPALRPVGPADHPGRAVAFAPPPLQRPHRYYETVRRRARRRYSTPNGFCRPRRSLSPGQRPGRFRTRLPTFPTKAAEQVHTASVPDTALSLPRFC